MDLRLKEEITVDELNESTRKYVIIHTGVKALKEIILDLQDSKECSLEGNRNLELILEQLTIVLFHVNHDLLVYEINEGVFNDTIEAFNVPYKVAISQISGKLMNYYNLFTDGIAKTCLYTCLVWCNEEVKRLKRIE